MHPPASAEGVVNDLIVGAVCGPLGKGFRSGIRAPVETERDGRLI